MQLRRLALGALALGIALPMAPAFAAPRPPAKACKQIKDDAGDATVKPTPVTSPTLDVLSADISSGRKEVTGTIRLSSADLENDNALRLGAGWNLNFTIGGINYTFFARYTGNISAGAPALTGGLTRGNTRTEPAATVRRAGNDLVWSVPRAALNELKKPKTYIYVTGANSGAASLDGDSALAKPNTRSLDKAPSCLTSK